jgi:predicted MPP superfamily phosphohydrolase
MVHPLTPDLTKLSDNELAEKISELNKRLAGFYQMGNHNAINQVNMLMQDYLDEQSNRMRETQKKMEEENSDKGWNDIIDIN